MTAVERFSAIRNPVVRAMALSRVSSVLGIQIINVAVGWQIYDRTGSAFALGLVGLFEVAPVLFFMIPAGNVADRFPRRNIAMVAQLVTTLAAFGLTAVSWFEGPVELIYAMLLLVGSSRAFSSPAIATILPQLLKPEQFVNANAWNSSAFQFSSAAGPAIGGFIIGWTGGATWAYFAGAVGQLIFILAFSTLPVVPPPETKQKRKLTDLLAGFHLIWRTPVFLAAITLDMFAVLLGGAVMLLPIFAKDILHVGPEGLGWLRAAPAVGSLCMLLTIAGLPPIKRPGRTLLLVVVGFGLATIGFGLSTSFLISMICLFFTGLFDAVSVVIRSTLEQVLTPDRLRGRVAAINYVFIGFSNELGDFESGIMAALIGPVAAAVTGGVGSILVVMLVAVVWPQLAKLGPMHTLKPQEDPDFEPDLEARRPV